MSDQSVTPPAAPVNVDETRLLRSLTNISPTAEQIQEIEVLRAGAKRFGINLLAACPSGRERALAVTKLEECVMWAVKAILL